MFSFLIGTALLQGNILLFFLISKEYKTWRHRGGW